MVMALVTVSMGAQNTPVVNGLNEAKFIYRTSADSLHAYFQDSFGFSLGYKNFSFGMKFSAELPKYSTNQSELLDELDAGRLSLAWKDLYVGYAKGAYSILGGTTEEAFGNGIAFRSFEDHEFDLDHRLTAFKFNYDEELRVKAIYGGLDSPLDEKKLDLAYGVDAEYPFFEWLSLGGSAVAMRNLTSFGTYSENDVYAGRAKLIFDLFEVSGEYAQRDLYHRGGGLPALDGDATYATASLSLSPVQVGGAYKNYDNFQFRLQDMPVANHHSETLSDDQATGVDEEGFQAWANWSLTDGLSLALDYAEAWNSTKEKKMNDAFAGLEWTAGEVISSLSWSQVEKLDDAASRWQKESYPELRVSFPAAGMSWVVSSEFKIVEKQLFADLKTHYEPKLQADLAWDKLSLSLGGGSWWEGFGDLMGSRYWANMEVKYPILEGSDIVLFAGKEPGGKVCRNGVCRYVAPFSGLRVELSTRF